MDFLHLVYAFFALRAKKAYTKEEMYHAARSPEPVEGQAETLLHKS
jgi:hypothetical protein